MKLACIIILLSLSTSVVGQKETIHWFLYMNPMKVEKEGITNTFNEHRPVNISSEHGSTSVSDAKGNLLFASDGNYIIDGNYNQNTVNLRGTGKVLTAVFPGDHSKHYLFYTTKNSSDSYSLRYAIVTVHSSGNIAVNPASTPIDTNLSRGYTLCIAEESDDFWIVVHHRKTNVFFSYKVTESGISTNPVKNAVGTESESLYNFDDLKTSPNGKLIAGYSRENYLVKGEHPSFLEVFDFNFNTGNLTYKIKSLIKVEAVTTITSVEFSADNRLVYVSKNIPPVKNFCEVKTALLIQYNLCYTNPNEFTKYASDVAELNSWCSGSKLTSVQMGADKKLHLNLMYGNYLSLINYPNRIGSSSGSNILAHRTRSMMWENTSTFNHSYIEKAVRYNIQYSAACYPDPVKFSISHPVHRVKWNFGDPSSADNTSELKTPQHNYSPGIYHITAELYDENNNQIEILRESVEIKNPNLRLLDGYPRDTTLCEGDHIIFKLNVINGIFHWYFKNPDGSISKEVTENSYWTKTPGTIYVEMRQNDCDGCIMYDSITINYVPRPNIDLEDSLGVCKGDSLLLSVNDPAASCVWSTGSTENHIWAKSAGMYWVEARANGCTLKDTVEVIDAPIQTYSLPTDTILCTGDKLQLHANFPETRIMWNDNMPGNSFEVTQAGDYWIELTNSSGCKHSDTISIRYQPTPEIDIGNDTTLCEGNVLYAGVQYDGADYLWNNGIKTSHQTISKEGVYWLKVNKYGCTFTDTIKVKYTLPPKLSLASPVEICDKKELIIDPHLQQEADYLWSNGSVDKTLTIHTPGIYSLTVSNSCGTDTDKVTVYRGFCRFILPNAFTPNNDGKNDVFKLKSTAFISKYHIVIYNRWGQQVYTSTDPGTGWDGRFKGVAQPQGTYLWHIAITDVDGYTYNEKGSILLLR